MSWNQLRSSNNVNKNIDILPLEHVKSRNVGKPVRTIKGIEIAKFEQMREDKNFSLKKNSRNQSKITMLTKGENPEYMEKGKWQSQKE